MKNPVLRVLINAILFSLISGVVVAILGLILGWQTSTQFSDGLFWAGAVFFAIGLVNLMGMFSQRTVNGLQFSQSAVHLDVTERFKIWDADLYRGYNLLTFLGTSGLLLFGLAGLVVSLF